MSCPPRATVTALPLSASVTATEIAGAALLLLAADAPQPRTASEAATTKASRALPRTDTLIDAPIGGCYIARERPHPRPGRTGGVDGQAGRVRGSPDAAV